MAGGTLEYASCAVVSASDVEVYRDAGTPDPEDYPRSVPDKDDELVKECGD